MPHADAPSHVAAVGGRRFGEFQSGGSGSSSRPGVQKAWMMSFPFTLHQLMVLKVCTDDVDG